MAGICYLLTIIFGALGEVYIPSLFIVTGDAATTAQNIAAAPGIYRLGFACYLIEGICDVGLAWMFYVLLRPVHKEIALLSAFFGLVSMAIYAVMELFYFSALFVARQPEYLNVFTRPQRDALLLLLLKFFGAGLFMVFYGIAAMLRGYLIFRSGYLPRFLGILLMAAGAGFILKNVTLVLAPAYSHNAFLAPMFFAAVALAGWLLVRGVDVQRWDARVADQVAGAD